MQLYISPQGNDIFDGSLKYPVKTLERAVLLVRKALKSGAKNITVNLEEGVYYLKNPVIFTPEDSGTEEFPVIYRGIRNAVISGGQQIYPEWEYFGNGIYRSVVPEGISFDQFFINHEKKIMARYPDYDPAVKYFQGCSEDCLSKERVEKYAKPEGGFIHAMHRALWGDMHFQITGKDRDGQLTYEGGWQNNRPSEMHGEIRFIENILEELDSPGEWYFDGEKYLYYYPEREEELQDAVYEVSCLKNLITLQGSMDRPVCGITFSNLEFRHAKRTFMETVEPVLRSDWCIYRGGAVFLEGTEHISFEKCRIYAVGGNGITISKYNRYARIRDCEISDAGANSILIAGDPGAVRSPLFRYEHTHGEEGTDMTPGPKSGNYPAKCLVEGNLLVRNGRVEKQTAGVSLSVCEEITISHNTIYDVPRAGINICDGTWGGHLIEKNAVFDTVRETQDHGAFNSWGRDRYWHPDYEEMEKILRENPDFPLIDAIKPVVMKNNIFECSDGWDIDLDDGSSNYLITQNLCLRGGIKNREGVHRTVTHNVMLHNTFHSHVALTAFSENDIFFFAEFIQ